MTDPLVDELVALLRLERLEDHLFRGESRDIGTHRVFGGQVLGQALSAAQQTVEGERSAHSLHAYFLRAGDIDAPIVYSVERTRDGGTFSSRLMQQIRVERLRDQEAVDRLRHELSDRNSRLERALSKTQELAAIIQGGHLR